MKKLQKISLVKLSKDELQKRELGKLLGGENCCICGHGLDDAADNNAVNFSDTGGYGTGSFRGN